MTRPQRFARPPRRALWPAALLAALFALLLAPRPAAAEDGDELTVSVLTMGPGDHPFFKFGHNALRIRDKKKKRDWVYNWGTFDFSSPKLIPTFLRGKLRYWLSTTGMAGTVWVYKNENRTLDEQILDLSPAQRLAIFRDAEENAKPENRYYKYDYYRDNCSTRVRDIVDRAVDGRLHAANTAPAEMTWRQHTRRLVADDFPFYFALHVVLGGLVDKPIDQWEEMFLPSKVAEGLRRTTLVKDGVEVPLVQKEVRILEAPGRAPLRDAPPRWTPYFLLVGLALGGAFVGLARRAGDLKAARVALGSLLSLVGFFFGFLGTFFVLVWLFTDHEVSHRNENILTCVPWGFALMVHGVGLARGKPAALPRAWIYARLALATALLGVLLKALPWFRQDSWEFLALLVPLWAGLALGLRGLLRDAPAIAPAAGPERPAAKPSAPEPEEPEEPEPPDEEAPEESGPRERSPEEPADEPKRRTAPEETDEA